MGGWLMVLSGLEFQKSNILKWMLSGIEIREEQGCYPDFGFEDKTTPHYFPKIGEHGTLSWLFCKRLRYRLFCTHECVSD